MAWVLYLTARASGAGYVGSGYGIRLLEVLGLLGGLAYL